MIKNSIHKYEKYFTAIKRKERLIDIQYFKNKLLINMECILGKKNCTCILVLKV